MIAWPQGRETFCHYVEGRQARRREMIATLRSNAQNEHSRKLADKLAKAWRIT